MHGELGSRWRQAVSLLQQHEHSSQESSLHSMRPNTSASDLAGQSSVAPHEASAGTHHGHKRMTRPMSVPISGLIRFRQSSDDVGAAGGTNTQAALAGAKITSHSSSDSGSGHPTHPRHTLPRIASSPSMRNTAAVQQLRLYAEALFCAGMNDLSRLQTLTIQVRPVAQATLLMCAAI